MARGEVILRQWNLLKTLQTRGEGIPLRELAEQFEVSERTIQRDFEILQELGFPIGHEEDEYGKDCRENRREAPLWRSHGHRL